MNETEICVLISVHVVVVRTYEINAVGCRFAKRETGTNGFKEKYWTSLHYY